MTTTPRTDVSTRSAWLKFGILASIEFLTVMDASIVNIAIPAIKQQLGFSAVDITWVVTSYLIPFAGFLLLAGRLADVVGRRRFFIVGTAAFTLASVGCGLAQEPWQLLAGRGVQGIGAAMVMPAALALITDVFAAGPARNRALGIFSGVAGIAAPAGLVLGGVLAATDWHLIFWINVPFGLLVVLVASRVLPSNISRPAPVDVIGAGAATGALMLLTWGAAELGSTGWRSPTTIAALAGAGALAATFAFRQVHARAPLIPGWLLERRNVVVGGAVFVLVGTILLSTFFFVTLFLQQVRGLNPLATAGVYLPLPLAMLIGAQLAPRFIGSLGVRTTLGAGLAVQAAALAGWALTSSASGSLVTSFLLAATPWAFGLGLSVVSSFVVGTSGVDGSAAGVASGLATTAYQGGGAVGLSIVAVIADTASHRAGNAGLDTLTATLDGHRTALWTLTGLALLGVALTRAIPED
ncbi:MAG: MFS transporter [Micromonosporaceae bacterium]